MGNKIGILSYYYHNYNCGGLLQAYAMQKVLNGLGYDSYHICLDKDAEMPLIKKNLIERLKEEAKESRSVLKFPYYVVKKSFQKCKRILAKKIFFSSFETIRSDLFATMERFEAIIPHTKQVYRYSDIEKVAYEFDIYICGSDQIWNPLFADVDIYSLGFVDNYKRKLSYAPSIANKYLTEEEITQLSDNLRSFTGVSLREEDYKEVLSNKLGREISIVLDPTLLLSRSDWDDMLQTYSFSEEEFEEANITEKYIFAYLLGDNPHNRKRILNYARMNGLSVVYCPYVIWESASGHLDDMKFGDYRICHLSPAVFIKLIKHAEFVATDSFHACVFSILYHKSFCALDRTIQKKLDMSSRLDTLLGSLGLERKYFGNGEEIAPKILRESDWVEIDKVLDKQRKYSMEYLNKALEE